MNIKYYLTLCAAVFALASCDNEPDPSEIDSATRISLSKEVVDFNADGTTADGEDAFCAIVTIVQGSKVNSEGWEYSVEDAKSCATVSATDITEIFNGTYEGDSRTYTGKGIEVRAAANTDYKRQFTVTIKAADGTEKAYTFTQLGEKADAAVTSDTKALEFMAAGGEQTVEFVSNMGDAVAFSASYEGGETDWLSWEAENSSSVTVTAKAWNGKDGSRTATLHIVVGTEDTSMATLDIAVSQLPADDYYFMYGASASGLKIEDALQLNKQDKGIYAIKSYFMSAETNAVLFNKDSRTLDYPYYALAKDGTVAEVASASASLPAGPDIDVDGMRSLVVNFNDMTWSWDRITTPNCMPDSEVANYKTKSFVARDGSMKEWMVEHMRWDGGDIRPKLGAKMVSSAAKATGGYSSDSVMPQSWDDATKLNLAYEEAEIGGSLQGDDTYGRIYCFSEMITGTPRWGVDNKINQTFPDGWTVGSTITDAVGDQITLECVANPGDFTGDNDADEQAHPMVKMQVQGICPYGWHIANLSDWLDIAWAAAKASDGHTFPVSEARVTYKQLTTATGTATVNDPDSPRGIGNLAPWLRNTTYWGSKNISDGADEFGFNYYPLGFRYMKQGYQMAGLRCQMWIPLYSTEKKAFRMNVVIKDHNSTYTEATSVDNGNAIMPFRCVRNYKK